uniref:Phosphatidic acid phosphatase type 2/haloperoxidase domain-containing protein n=1 Tax=Aegilops tauschii subsp. strangulata TaxID=200361 RepID=A0A452ZRC4_AEGTS
FHFHPLIVFYILLQLLNQIVSDLSPEHPIISTFRPLREPLGHSPFQVFVGALVGCTIAYLMGRSV